MSLLEHIESGTSLKPQRTLLYGTPGIGKSSWAAAAPKPIFIQTEDGIDNIACDKFPLVTKFSSVMKFLLALDDDDHDYQTIVIDSLDWLERLIWAHVCEERGVENIEDIGYGKGYHFALTLWRDALEALNRLRANKNMQVILVAHSKIEKFENPETDNYDRYAPRLHKLASALVQEWCDNVLFACYRVHTKSTDEGFKKSAKAVGTGERMVRTTERPAHMAKNRIGLPDEMLLDYQAFHNYASFDAAQMIIQEAQGN